MKIEKLVIYSFGKHENISIQLGSHVNVLYGLNEAGKTTIQQFILHILFGFPARNSSLLRYEPKSGGKYGGQVHIQDSQFGKCTIERVQGKSAGEVTVYFEDGKQGGEEALQRLLREYDRAAFESIFSFSLLQLQGFEKMDEEELSRTLLASGTTGVDSLLEVEKRMEKEMGELFKRSGRIPLMNVKMQELRELEIELKVEEERVAAYAPSIGRIRKIAEMLATLRAQEKKCREQLQTYSLLQQLLPLSRQKEQLEARLSQLKDVRFPSDGIRRFESLTGKLTEAEAAKKRVVHEMTEVEALLQRHEQPEKLMEMELLLAKESEWHRWRAALVTATDEWQRLDGLERRHMDRLGVKGEEAEAVLLAADVSIRKEEEMHELLRDMEELSREISFAESQKGRVEKEWEETRAKLQALEVPSTEDEESVREWPKIKQKLAEAKAFVSLGERRTNRHTQALPLGLFLLALVCVIFGLVQQQWVVVLVGVVIGVGGGWMYPKKDDKHHASLREMRQFIADYESKELEMERLTFHLENYRHERERLEEAEHTWESRYEKLVEELDELVSREVRAEGAFDLFMQQYGFDGLPSPGIVPELFRIIRDMQEVAREKEAVAEQQKIFEAHLARRVSAVKNVLDQHVASEGLYELLRRKYSQLKEAVEQNKVLQARKAQLEPLLEEKIVLVEAYEKGVSALLAEAAVETEEAFYTAYDRYQEMSRLQEQVAQIEKQLSANQISDELKGATENELEQRVKAVETEMSAIDQQMTSLIHEKASLENKTEQLLTDETHGDKLQLLAMKKAELAALAQKWSSRKAIAEAIRRTMFELKEKKLPKVLDRAADLFHQLTEEKYEALALSEKGTFLAITSTGRRYPIAELSQATKEQAYISLRLALAESVLLSAPFPIIMDDPFVHFDERRLSRMIKILGTLTKHQFIYFTCHQKMKEQWTDATVINVSDMGSEQGAFTL